jgi:TRAP-type mannitol/chloroaromatic compound transport system permease small subunit
VHRHHDVGHLLRRVHALPSARSDLYGIPYAETSWAIHEVSIYSPTGAPVYPHKTLIPIAAALMLLQCFAEIVRCIICLRDGVWPQRLHDVEEMESAILAEAEDRRRIEQEMHVEAGR